MKYAFLALGLLAAAALVKIPAMLTAAPIGVPVHAGASPAIDTSSLRAPADLPVESWNPI